jgi:TP901 family phage tail tape measure protein
MATLALAIDARKARAGARAFSRATDMVKSSAGGAVSFVQKRFDSINLKRAALAISAYTGLSVKAFASFESQMAQVRTMLNEQTAHLLPAYANAIKGMAMDFGEGTKELSGGLYNILSASVPAEKAIRTLEVSVKAAKAGLTDTATAAYAITGILNAYGVSADKAGRISDILFSTVKSGQTTFAQLAPVIGRVTAISAEAGISLEEVAASLSTITRGGISTDEAVTGLRQAIIALQGSSDQAVTTAKQYGIELSVQELRAKGLAGMIEKLSKLSGEVRNEIFREVRARTALNVLIGDQTGLLSDYEKALRSAGMTQEAYDIVTQTLTQDFARLWQAIKIVSVNVAGRFSDQLKDLTGYLLENSKDFAAWAENAAGRLSGFVEFLRTDWKVGIKTGLDISLELFKGFGRALFVVMEDIFVRLYNNIGVWIARAFAQEQTYKQYVVKFNTELKAVGGLGGWLGIGGEENKRRLEQAERMAREALQKDIEAGIFKTAFPEVDRNINVLERIRKITDKTKAAIREISREADIAMAHGGRQNWLGQLSGYGQGVVAQVRGGYKKLLGFAEEVNKRKYWVGGEQ